MEPLRRVAALLGRLIGLRTQESEITVTGQGKWTGWFDPVRLTLAALVVALSVFIGFCTALNLDDEGTPDPVTEGPYQCCP